MNKTVLNAAAFSAAAAAGYRLCEIKAHAWKSDTHSFIAQNALAILKNDGKAEAYDILSLHAADLLRGATCPDYKGDTDKGHGFHYYCARDMRGKKLELSESGYYKSGKNITSDSAFSRSARTIFEDNYQAALSFYAGGNTHKFVEFAGRCVHMLSDVCCPPHTSNLTLTSVYARRHKQFEDHAKEIFHRYSADSCEPGIYERFEEGGFGGVFNELAVKSSDHYDSIVFAKNPDGLDCIIEEMLITAQKNCAAMLERLCRDAVTGKCIICGEHYCIKNAKTGRYICKGGRIGLQTLEKPANVAVFSLDDDGVFNIRLDGERLTLMKRPSGEDFCYGIKIGNTACGYRLTTAASGYSKAVTVAGSGELCTAIYDPDDISQHWSIETAHSI